MPDKPFPQFVQTTVLVRYKRRCALCYGIENDARAKNGQIAHIDRNRENDTLGNAAFLCTDHHDRYDTRSRQTKGFTPDELRKHQEALLAYMGSLPAPVSRDRLRKSRSNRKVGVSLDVYDRRVPIYGATVQFVLDVLKDLRPEVKLILKFAADTDQALFLFDESIAEYLADLFKRALRLHTLELMRTRMQTDDREMENFPALVKEETALAEWFSQQHGEIRARFAPFLRLA